MKKIIFVLFAAVILLNLSSCAAPDQEYSYNIKDALKISAYVFDETIEGNIYDGEDTFYELEQLKINEIRMMAPIGTMNTLNLPLYLEFEGIIEVLAENEDMQLSINDNLTPWYNDKAAESGRTFDYNAKLVTQGFVCASLLPDDYIGMAQDKKYTAVFAFSAEVGTERYLNVNAYRFDNEKTPIIQAKLKLVLIEDKIQKMFGNDNFSSRCFSIELISYEYSDMYRIMDDITDEDE